MEKYPIFKFSYSISDGKIYLPLWWIIPKVYTYIFLMQKRAKQQVQGTQGLFFSASGEQLALQTYREFPEVVGIFWGKKNKNQNHIQVPKTFR